MARFTIDLAQLDAARSAISDADRDDLYKGMRALADSAFPKKCRNCGREFANAEAFVRETERLAGGVSGLKQSCDDDGSSIVELFRNCPCGSTLMDSFTDRRDVSEAGLARRRKFGELLDKLIGAGLEREIARAELLNIVRGRPSKLLKPSDD